jgi:glycosyltransferase involved in cell wall biosynthesis
VKVLVATAMYPTPEKPNFGAFIRAQVEALRRADVEVEVLVLDGPNRKLIYPKGVVDLRRRVAAGGIDLVHAHYSYVGGVARMQRRVPIVVSYCGDDLLGTVDPRGRTRLKSRLTAAGGRVLGELVDAVIVKSAAMAAKLRRRDVYVIPHGLDFEIFRPIERDAARRQLGLNRSTKYVLFAANPEIPVKRFPLARAAVDELTRQDASVELLVVHKETQDALALYMNACDALVFPSFQEGSPNIVKQAMACSLPIVATDVGDVREVIGGTAGCHVCDAEPAAIAGRLAEILERGERTSGRHDIRHLDSRIEVEKVKEVYRVALSRRRSTARHDAQSAVSAQGSE